MFDTLQPLVLASASPRRREMLAELGLEFTVAAADIVEEAGAGEEPASFARRLAVEKAAAVAAGFPAAWVLGADTVVALGDRILGKPADARQAEEMLAALSGREHTVWTGFALLRGREQVVAAVATRVWFAELDPDLIRAYVATGEPLDKAGAYGIQGRGGVLVRQIEGSASNVIGLPLAEVCAALREKLVVAPAC